LYRKRFAQHFLEPAWIAKIVRAISPHAGEVFVEIGPGPGNLTLALASSGARVIAVEIDRDLASVLQRDAPAGVSVVIGDFLETDVPALLAAEHIPSQHVVRIAGNIPYNISSPILFKLLRLARENRRFRDATLLMQREVVDRIVASPGSRDYGVLAVLTALHADAERVLTVPPGAFRPAPRVTSSVVRLVFRPPTVELQDAALFETMVRTIFQQRRKTLRNALKPFVERLGPSADSVLDLVSLDLTRRPETLQLQEFAALADKFASRRT
jgi:16S rRNA (adenine1518-N6/adenine1519-N6)-dimethyltransferase